LINIYFIVVNIERFINKLYTPPHSDIVKRIREEGSRVIL